jgi:hypothetical protein
MAAGSLPDASTLADVPQLGTKPLSTDLALACIVEGIGVPDESLVMLCFAQDETVMQANTASACIDNAARFGL